MTFTPYVDVCAGTNTSHARFVVAALPIAHRIETKKGIGDLKLLIRLKQGILNA
jgi:hypothetical protein